jgi:hypothetical protein
MGSLLSELTAFIRYKNSCVNSFPKYRKFIADHFTNSIQFNSIPYFNVLNQQLQEPIIELWNFIFDSTQKLMAFVVHTINDSVWDILCIA